MRYLLDEDVNPAVSEAARTLGLDVLSVHEIGRAGLAFPDEAQLHFAAAERRIIVTRNRDDFIRLTRDFFQAGQAHYGVLVVPHTLPNRDPGRIARALKQWHDARPTAPEPEPYIIDFLAG